MSPRPSPNIHRFLFLVHPFYAMYHNWSHHLSNSQRISASKLKKGAQFLSSRWLKAITRGLVDPHVMIVIVKVDPMADELIASSIKYEKQWASEFQKADMQVNTFIRKVKRLAGPRLIQVNDTVDIPTFMTRLRKSGFNIHPRFNARFFGEALYRCTKWAHRDMLYFVLSRQKKQPGQSALDRRNEIERRIRTVPWLSTGALNPIPEELGENEGLGSYAKNLKKGVKRLREARNKRIRSR